VEPLDEGRPDEGQHGDGRGQGREDLHEDRQADDGGDHADDRSSGEHREDQVEAEHLRHAEHDRETEPGLPEVVADPVHGPTLSSGA
jgi:hypothetical protein